MRCLRMIYHQSIGIVMMAMLCCFSACTKGGEKPIIDAVSDRSAMPILVADSVSTLVSDSGITRYRIKAVRWEMYDKAKPAHWKFPKGIYLEKFNEALEVEASLEADSAYYNEEAQVWRLDGNVHALNLEGERFETPQLFWEQKKERIYSDSVITIHRETSTITGIGFESNQEMTKYTIQKPTGYFPIKEDTER